MAVSDDISNILGSWEYEPNEVSVRAVVGDDGREKIQMRLDMGLLQMEMDGRPDGRRPEGCESWLEYYQQQAEGHAALHAEGENFELTSEDCARLLREGIQYYHRYVSLWHLRRFDNCARDTARNLRLFQFVRQHAADDRDKLQFDQWRAYVIMMYTRAIATPMVDRQEYGPALDAVDEGIKRIWEFLEEYGQTHRAKQCTELTQLEQWRKEILAERAQPRLTDESDPLSRLKRDLDDAVREERFEDAARLRDEIRRASASASPLGTDGPQL